MIRFEGIPSKACKSEIVHRRAREARKAFLLFFPPIILTSFLMCFLFKRLDFYLYPPLLSIVFLCCIFQLSRTPKKVEQLPIQRKVVITDTCVTEEISKAKAKIEDVKRVLKTEYCYYIQYSIWHAELECPRETLTEGTEEDFETLFQGKIITVNSKNKV